MKLHTIETGLFKLDGGAMFGVVPKSLWNRRHPADEDNLCAWAMRCLLVEDGNRLVLIDSGIGDKQSEKFFSYYHLHGNDSLQGSLRKLGYGPEDITHHIITHLHFDHCGGSVARGSDGSFVPAFPNAEYIIGRDQWLLANNPNPREKASFLKENFEAIGQSGQLRLVDAEAEILPNISVRFYDGHTDGMMVPFIRHKGEVLVYVTDLLPSHHHLPVAWVMAYDTRPLVTMEEKEIFAREAANNGYVLFFEHDLRMECTRVEEGPRGPQVQESFRLSEWA